MPHYNCFLSRGRVTHLPGCLVQSKHLFRYCLITHLEELRVRRRPLASGLHYVLSRYTYGVFTLKRDTACLYAPTLHRTPTDEEISKQMVWCIFGLLLRFYPAAYESYPLTDRSH